MGNRQIDERYVNGAEDANAGPVILTGSSGFIGTHVLKHFMKQSLGFVTVDIRALEEDGVNLRARDIDGTYLDVSGLRDCTLVHLAWCPPVRDSVYPHAQQLQLLSKLLDVYGSSISRIIAIGSAEEYGASGGRLIEQNAVDHGLSPYGWGKRSAQMLVETWCQSNKKPGLWLRPFTVYGEGQRGNMAIPYAVRQARKREMAEFSAGTQVRDFIHVDDVARAISLAATKEWDGFNVANLGTGTGTTLREVLEQVAALFDADELFQFGKLPMRPGEPDVQIADTERAASLLGFKSEVTVEMGIDRIQKALSQNDDSN